MTDHKDHITEIIGHLNAKAGTRYRATGKETIKFIERRLSEDFTIEDFFYVIEVKVEEWGGTDMAKYLRPETLFGNRFESYRNQRKRGAIKPLF